MRGAPTAARPLTDADYLAIRRAALAHLVCTVCGYAANPVVGERHGGLCYASSLGVGALAVRAGDPDPPWAHVSTSHGDAVVVASPDRDLVDVYLIPSVGFMGEAPLQAAELLARGVRRVRRAEAEEHALVASLRDQRDRLCFANADLGVLLLCMTHALENRRDAVDSLDVLGLKDYLVERGWRDHRPHPSGLGWEWTRDTGQRLLLADREAGDYLERTWEVLVGLGRFERRDPTVILAYLMARDVERARALRWAEPTGTS